ncbi:response regulator transcription factor [Gemmobacter lanyuensis]
MDQIRIVIADDHPLYREGVARTLSEDAGLLVVGQAQDAPGAVELTERMTPDLLLLDISMPGAGAAGATAGHGAAQPAQGGDADGIRGG